MSGSETYDVRSPFAARVGSLPRLGLGISTEFGAGATGLDVEALERAHPDWVQFLEIGIDLERGIDAAARRWVERGRPTTYHFLDVNLEQRESLDADWIAGAREMARAVGARWLCGDAGLWHLGPRDRGHGVLAPPILTRSSAEEMAENIRYLRERIGLEVLPENPPAHVYVGDLDLLEYFARVIEGADSGMLLDIAHLAIYQHVAGRGVLDGLDAFPLDRIVEIHVAGGSFFEHGGRRFVDDDHSPEPLDATWQLLAYLAPRTPALRAVVFECERNAVASVLPGFARIAELVGRAA